MTTVLDITGHGWNLLVTSDVHWPGWRATWNGHPQTPVTVNGAFLRCFIPPAPANSSCATCRRSS
jgi:hypothetical protein